MNPFERTYKKNLASDGLGRQIWGALLKRWWLTAFFVLLALIGIMLPACLSHRHAIWRCLQIEPVNKIVWLSCLTLFLATVVSTCNILTDIGILLKKENRITWCQIIKLLSVGIWIIGFVFIFNIRHQQTSYIIFGLTGSVLTWIFQDKIKGAMAFIHLRRHNLLRIGDWIKVPKLDVDGEVKKVTLTTVTLGNWDTSTSTVPMSALQEGHFINLQNMAKGKTYGRRMYKTFLLDTGWMRPINEEEVAFFKSGGHGIPECLPESEIVSGVLNAHLYRLYLYHWLMNHPHISRKPRLIVRWMDQKDSGMELQVYAFITECSLDSFEWQQSQIIEHVITSMDWFGLRLYQSPSAYDASNSNIYITNKPATCRKEDKR